MNIIDVTAEEIRDSRGNPTLSVTVACEDGARGSFAVPSGASTGATEAIELRDSQEPRAGVHLAARNVETEIRGALVGMDAREQRAIDEKMIALDGTENKSRLGGNALIGASVAACRAGAAAKNVPLPEHLRTLADIAPSHGRAPYLYMNLVNGGKHAATQLAFQEYIVVPRTESPRESLAIGAEAMHRLDDLAVREFDALPAIGDEGGLAMNAPDIETPMRYLAQIREEMGKKFDIALDIAADSFYEKGVYRTGTGEYATTEFTERLAALAATYEFISIEDPFEESDFSAFARLHARLAKTKIVGDDLTTTNVTRLGRAIREKSIDAIIIKPNQVGTVSETLDTMALARKSDIECIVSHRSGETMDSFISDLAFAFRTFGIKVGAPRKPERMVKIERLIELTTE